MLPTAAQIEEIRGAKSPWTAVMDWVGITAPVAKAATEQLGELTMLRDLAGLPEAAYRETFKDMKVEVTTQGEDGAHKVEHRGLSLLEQTRLASWRATARVVCSLSPEGDRVRRQAQAPPKGTRTPSRVRSRSPRRRSSRTRARARSATSPRASAARLAASTRRPSATRGVAA